MGRLGRALAGFDHRAAFRPDFLWHLDNALHVEPWAREIVHRTDHDLVTEAFQRYRHRVVPVVAHLRTAVVHNDANDRNVLVDGGHVSGIIDFGDVVLGRQIHELAVTLAYALLDQPDVVAAGADVIGAYHAEFPLTDDELRVVYDLAATRLAMSVAISTHQGARFPDNDYLVVSQAPALRLLRRLMAIRPEYLHFSAREAVGLPPVPQSNRIVHWLRSPHCAPVPPVPLDLRRAPRTVVDLTEGSPAASIGSEPDAAAEWVANHLRRLGAAFGVGRYDEDRSCYRGDQYASDGPETRSVHLGIDLFVDEGTPVRAMLPGTVETVVDNARPLDYGPTVVLRHHTDDGTPFWVLYGHLTRGTLTAVAPGQPVEAGQVVGAVGDQTVNGGWPPHVHIQLITDLMADPWRGPDGNFEGAGEPARMNVWRSISPDPNLLIGLSPESFDLPARIDDETLLDRRRTVLSPSLSLSYRNPLHIVRGNGAWLYDTTGRGHVDAVNNVCHVGHSHPHVVHAISAQASRLNTNTRYLHPTIVDYAERLAALFPDPLEVVFLVNSGSEANELALRIARTATARHDVVALDWGYHGNTNDLVEISPYKFLRKGGTGRPPHTHVAELPDPYRGRFRSYDLEHGRGYAASVATALEAATARGRGAAAFIAESISGCGGQVVFPEGYLAAAYEHARGSGAVCIADEVQVGFGRVGDAMWAFELQGVVPDIVTLGKPMGNGHPVGAVVTTRVLADAFANGMEFFSTFGGNPVSAAAASAVLDVMEIEGLQQRAVHTGAHLVSRLRELQVRHPAIGDVRGHGLFLGVDLVTDPDLRTPDPLLAADVVNRMRDRGVLVSSDGPADNVLKLKPPLAFGIDEADILCDELDRVLVVAGPSRHTSHTA
jgi:4-aminobutyrate aminotransferase-like enzyme